MNGEHISKSLSALPEDMINEATLPRNKHSFHWRVIRIAACLAVIIGLLVGIPQFNSGSNDITVGSGILAVTVCAMDVATRKIVSEQLEAGIDVENSHYWPLVMNIYPGLPIFSLCGNRGLPGRQNHIRYFCRLRRISCSKVFWQYIDNRNT